MSEYILYGIYEYENEETEYGTILSEHRMAVASFDELEDAEEYIELSKTPQYQEYGVCFDRNHSQFKEESLLNGSVYAEIEENDPLPHNPVMR